MAWRIVRQPNGYYARFSEIVDDFTVYDMTRAEAIVCCRREQGMGKLESGPKLRRADSNPKWFEEAMGIIKFYHGAKTAATRRRQLTRLKRRREN